MECMDMKKTVVICECVHGDRIYRDKIQEIKSAINRGNNNTILVKELCRLAVSDSQELIHAIHERSIQIVACHPRAVKWLLHRAGISTSKTPIAYLNIRTQSAKHILDRIGARRMEYLPNMPRVAVLPSTYRTAEKQIREALHLLDYRPQRRELLLKPNLVTAPQWLPVGGVPRSAMTSSGCRPGAC